MSSIFTALTDIFGTAPAKKQPLQIGRGYEEVRVGHVIDVILDSDSPYYGADYGFGAIRVRFVQSDSFKGEESIVVVAIPIDRCNYEVPLPGEQVVIYVTLVEGKRRYVYGQIIKQSLNSVYGAAPFLGTKPIYVDPLTLFALVDEDQLAIRFEEKLQIPVQIYQERIYGQTVKREGDTIIEGRFGAQIRFTSTMEKYKPAGDGLIEILENNKMTIAGNDIVKPNLTEDGDPLTILQVVKRTTALAESTFVEDSIDAVESAVYLTSTQEIPMAINTSKRMASWDVQVLRQDPNQLKEKSDTIRLQSTFDGVYDPNFKFTVNLNITIPGGGGGGSIDPGSISSGTKAQNIQLLISTMTKMGITNKFAQAAILGVVGKESGYIPRGESGYGTTGAARLRDLFGRRLKKFATDAELGQVAGFGLPSTGNNQTDRERNQLEFYDHIYGYKRSDEPNEGVPGKGGAYGNNNPGDGWNYRGRGMNQVTFKGGYKTFGEKVNLDLVSNPELLNDADVAATVAVTFLTGVLRGTMRKEPNNFTSLEEAIEATTTANHGGGKRAPQESYVNATAQANACIAAGYIVL